MIDFSPYIDLPMIWGTIIAIGVFMYVLLDGFDLGVGILFPFAPSDKCRDRMMNSIAPFWDGNETWLVLGGGGLFAAFPLAYSILMPAFYLPILFMLLGLIFRGVAFEFRFKSSGWHRKFWDYAFHFGSLTAAFFQGVILGAYVQGIEVTGKEFSGSSLDWVSAFAIVTGISVVFGYALIGSTWLIMKTEDITAKWSRAVANYVLFMVAIAMLVVSISMPIMSDRVRDIWFSFPKFYYLLPIPVITGFVFLLTRYHINKRSEYLPFILSILIFLSGYIGLSVSIWPWIIPFHFTVGDAAAHSTSLSVLLIGTVIFLPLILAYTAYSYYIFRGKSGHEKMY